MGMLNPSRESKFSGANGNREIFVFPVQLLAVSRIGNLTRLITTSRALLHSLLQIKKKEKKKVQVLRNIRIPSVLLLVGIDNTPVCCLKKNQNAVSCNNIDSCCCCVLHINRSGLNHTQLFTYVVPNPVLRGMLDRKKSEEHIYKAPTRVHCCCCCCCCCLHIKNRSDLYPVPFSFLLFKAKKRISVVTR